MSELQALVSKLGISCKCVYGRNKSTPPGMERMHPYRVTLRFQKRQLTVDFFTGEGWTKEPDAADVLSCLVMDVSSGELPFEEFCAEMGYDYDSRKAEKIWESVCKMAPKMRRFLGDDFESVAQAEH